MKAVEPEMNVPAMLFGLIAALPEIMYDPVGNAQNPPAEPDIVSQSPGTGEPSVVKFFIIPKTQI